MDADEGPSPAIIIPNNAATESGSRLVEVIIVVDSEGVLVSLYFVANQYRTKTDKLAVGYLVCGAVTTSSRTLSM